MIFINRPAQRGLLPGKRELPSAVVLLPRMRELPVRRRGCRNGYAGFLTKLILKDYNEYIL